MNESIIDKVSIQLYENCLIRIKSGLYYDKNLRIYDISLVKKMVSYFETIERFEDCQILVNFFEKRFNHQLNYLDK